MKKRIVFEDPTPSLRGRNGGSVQTFLNELSETPDKWAVFARNAKHISYYYTIASKRNDVKVAVRRNSDNKTHTVYFMVLGTSAQKTRVAEKAKRASHKPAKKATKKVVVKTVKKSAV
jgi:hypothetical protein